MTFADLLLAPIALLLPSAGAIERAPAPEEPSVAASAAVPQEAYAWPQVELRDAAPDWPFAPVLFQSAHPDDAWQVHIEQRMQIRIIPRNQAPVPRSRDLRDMFVGIPDRDEGHEYTERKIGKCVSIAGIGGVQPDRANRLLLYMRDRRLVSAELERSCRARDFYSGFYMERTADGQLCVDRDVLLSRSGMNCKLTRIRQLVEDDR